MLLLISITIFCFCSSPKRIETEENKRQMNELINVSKKVIESQKMSEGEEFVLIKIFNAISERKYYAVYNENKHLIKVTNNLLSLEKNVNSKFINDLVSLNYKSVPPSYIDNSCDGCDAVEYILVTNRENEVVILKREQLTSGYNCVCP